MTPPFGHYEVERVLGRGAMGTVYLARDQRIGRRVALKTISLSDEITAHSEFHRRLQREAEIGGALVHPNIVTLYEAGYDGDRISYLAMEYVEGKTLLDLMKETAPAPLEVDTSLRVVEDVLRGLAHAHERGIIHRDIKPANVLIAADGVVKIADFGIARPQSSSLTAAGRLMGTPNYMSPEQVLGHALTPKGDVFSAGVMLFEMLTAVKPFIAADLTGTLHNILRQPAPHASDLNPKVPRSLGDLVARMVAKAPEERPPAAEVLREIARLRRPATHVVAKPAAVRKQRAVWPWLLIGSIVSALAILAGVVSMLTQREEQPTVQIAPDRLQEFEGKRRALDLAESAYTAGRYQESLDHYNAYLAKYPDSAAAIQGRDRARGALERQSQPATKVTRRQKRSRRDEDISPAEMLRRLKKALTH